MTEPTNSSLKTENTERKKKEKNKTNFKRLELKFKLEHTLS